MTFRCPYCHRIMVIGKFEHWVHAEDLLWFSTRHSPYMEHEDYLELNRDHDDNFLPFEEDAINNFGDVE